MEVIVGITGAATIASYLVAFYKLGKPDTTSFQLVIVAIAVGQIASVAVAAAGEQLVWSQKGIANIFLGGILASAAAAGLSRTDQSAEAKRTGPDAPKE
jgi:hypothetical protein